MEMTRSFATKLTKNWLIATNNWPELDQPRHSQMHNRMN